MLNFRKAIAQCYVVSLYDVSRLLKCEYMYVVKSVVKICGALSSWNVYGNAWNQSVLNKLRMLFSVMLLAVVGLWHPVPNSLR